jgi:hypothetical protein
LHAFGFGTAYNPFARELSSFTFDPGPSIAVEADEHFFIGVSGPGLFERTSASSFTELTPITTETDAFRSGPDITVQPAGASAIHYFVAFDAAGKLAIYYYVVSTAPAYWATPVKLSAPVGSFAFSPAICTENGGFGVYSVNVIAAAGGRLWHATTSSITTDFSPWTMISTDVASSPDCTITGADSTIHVVTLSTAGKVVDTNGKGTSWATIDLGFPR